MFKLVSLSAASNCGPSLWVYSPHSASMLVEKRDSLVRLRDDVLFIDPGVDPETLKAVSLLLTFLLFCAL